MDSKVYYGWKIYTHLGKVNPQEIPYLKRKIESWVDQNTNSPVQIIFKDKTTEQEEAMGLRKYGIVIESNFFGYRGEYAHQQLCYDVLQRISWQKQAYLVMDSEWRPVPLGHFLRMR